MLDRTVGREFVCTKKITIGTSEVLFTTTLLILDGQSSTIQFDAPNGEILSVELLFLKERREHKVSWEISAQGLKIYFSDFNNSLGEASTELVKLGKILDKDFGFVFAVHKIGIVNSIVITFLQGGN